jgi:hypothetical protein
MSISSVASSSAYSASPAGVAAAGKKATPSDAEQRVITQLKQRDREVRAHELAHVAAGAGLVTHGASYTYQTGPDGQRYAIGGEVGIDVSPARTPEETIAKAEQIKAAALAPADPSGPDRQIAARAGQMEMEARMEIAAQSSSTGALAGKADALYRSVAQAGAAPDAGSQLNTYA